MHGRLLPGDRGGGRGASSGSVRPAREHGGGASAAADQPDREGPGEVAASDRGEDVLNGTDHRSHGEQNAAIGAYIRLRNARAEPKTNFAPDSPIRTWTQYPIKAA